MNATALGAGHAHPSTATTLANFWHPVALASEVTEQPKRFTLLGEDIVLFRDRDGVAAFKDLCIHRGTALSLGHITDGRLTCAYHGWQYDRTGACVSIPSLPPGSPVPRKARAIVHQAADAYGLVWVALDNPVQPIPPYPDDSYENPSFHTFVVDMIWKTSAGRACENGLDLSHLNFVHAGYLELADGSVMKPHKVTGDDFALRYTYVDGHTHRDYFLYAPFTMFIKKYASGDLKGSAGLDAVMTSDSDSLTVVSQMHTPIDATTTRVYAHMTRNYALDHPDDEFHELLRVVMEQDRKIVESQRPERIPLDLREELHLKVPDATGIAYRGLLSKIGLAAPFVD
jgi:phenylpropionate dioxygenase-like ring-hydroxylating dioxygenase large terminal subunit